MKRFNDKPNATFQVIKIYSGGGILVHSIYVHYFYLSHTAMAMNISRDKDFDSTLALLRIGYPLLHKKTQRYQSDIFQIHGPEDYLYTWTRSSKDSL